MAGDAESKQVMIGVDIGGSGVKVGVVAADGAVLAKDRCAIDPHDKAPERVVAITSELVEGLLLKAEKCKEDVLGVGIVCPGVLFEGGVLHAAANFPDWLDVPLQDLMSKKMGLKVSMGNDADAAVLAEQMAGSAKGGVNNVIMLTLGTGVGCGLIVDGKLVRGGTGMSEGGHLIVERNGRLCGCSQRGCLEAYSSAGALVQEAQEHLTAGADSKLSAYPIEEINAELIFRVAAEGDAMCKRLIEEVADYLGFACVTLCRILDPEVIVLSGGMAEAGEMFVELVRSAYLKYSWTRLPNPVRIEKAGAGYDSGIIGAAAFANMTAN